MGWINQPGVQNWVDCVGGLPKNIKDVALNLMAKGFQQQRAIAVAVNVVKQWCRGGVRGDPRDFLNWRGRQVATLRTRMKGCATVLEWNTKRARARAMACPGRRSRR